MKKHAVLLLLLSALFSASVAGDAFALSIGSIFKKSIQPEHLTCEKDADCALIEVGCKPCGGDYAAVNVKFAETYESLGECTREEIKRRGEVKCASSETRSAVCKEQQCAVERKEIIRSIPQ